MLYNIKRHFNEFNEEQATILNNKLEQADNARSFYYQTKLNFVQKKMSELNEYKERDTQKKPLIIIERLLQQLRFDKDKKKQNAVYLKYQAWLIRRRKNSIY